NDDVKKRLKFGIAGIKNPGEHNDPVAAAEGNNALQKYIIENNRWGIPALFVTESYNGVDAEGCTIFGRPVNQAATFNPKLVNKIWDVVGKEARLRGMHMCHSPEADLVRDPRFGRMSEAFGEDTYLTTEMVTAAITGVQGGYSGQGEVKDHIGAVVKHFAGYGQVLGGTNFAAIEISERTLNDEIFPPFKAAVQDAHALGMMASHGDLNGIASHGNPWLLTKVLREQWGFQGYMVSDANDIGRLHYFMKVAETPDDAALMGLKAGMDVDLYADDAYALLPKLVAENPDLEKLLDRSAGRVLRTKFILGLFDDPYIDVRDTERNVRAATSLELARQQDRESTILLKNENDLLPFKADDTRSFALLGPLVKEGTAAAFREVVPNATFVADAGFKLTDENRSIPKLVGADAGAMKGLMSKAKAADVVVLFLGGDEYTAKEAFFNGAIGDRAEIHPVGPQDDLIKSVKALGKPVIVVLKHRRTLAINVIADQADAILDSWDLSEFGDQSLARMIFGLDVPSGRLPVTVPRSIGQLPFHYSGKEINNKKGYLFLKIGPLYPFGYGLSYGKIVYGKPTITGNTLRPDGALTVNVEVSNQGQHPAQEVVQLYLKDEIGSVTRPDRELKAFKKVNLPPGASEMVRFSITSDQLRFTRADGVFGLESGDYQAIVGPSSAEGTLLKFRLITD
ncbi:MAG: glycoside hydrolase family 3 N-terminal domain-containing protein, partial [Bacteroidota bacterium]